MYLAGRVPVCDWCAFSIIWHQCQGDNSIATLPVSTSSVELVVCYTSNNELLPADGVANVKNVVTSENLLEWIPNLWLYSTATTMWRATAKAAFCNLSCKFPTDGYKNWWSSHPISLQLDLWWFWKFRLYGPTSMFCGSLQMVMLHSFLKASCKVMHDTPREKDAIQRWCGSYYSMLRKGLRNSDTSEYSWYECRFVFGFPLSSGL